MKEHQRQFSQTILDVERLPGRYPSQEALASGAKAGTVQGLVFAVE
jgi:hypothetical protein